MTRDNYDDAVGPNVHVFGDFYDSLTKKQRRSMTFHGQFRIDDEHQAEVAARRLILEGSGEDSVEDSGDGSREDSFTRDARRTHCRTGLERYRQKWGY